MDATRYVGPTPNITLTQQSHSIKSMILLMEFESKRTWQVIKENLAGGLS